MLRLERSLRPCRHQVAASGGGHDRNIQTVSRTASSPFALQEILPDSSVTQLIWKTKNGGPRQIELLPDALRRQYRTLEAASHYDAVETPRTCRAVYERRSYHIDDNGVAPPTPSLVPFH